MQSKSEKKTILSSYENFNAERILFLEPKQDKFDDKKDNGELGVPISFYKIFLKTKNPDGSEGDLILSTPSRLFSFGISKNSMSGSVGFTFPLCLFSRDGATAEEKKFLEVFESIVEKCKKHILEVKDEIEQYDLEPRDLEKKKVNPLYYKKEKYTDPETKKTTLRNVPGVGPTLYAKLMYSAKKGKIATKFYSATEKDEHGEELQLDPYDLISTETDKKFFYAQGALKFESIFIGATGAISLQIKLMEAIIEPSMMGGQRLLKSSFTRPTADETVSVFNPAKNQSNPLQTDDKDETNSLVEEEISMTPPPTPVKAPPKVVKRVVKKPVAE